jgi:hypothetical protein
MTQANFTEQIYLCLAISILVILYVFLLVLDSPWTNHGVSLLQQDCNFSIFTEIMLVNSPQERGIHQSMKEIEETLKLGHLHHVPYL